MGKECTKCLIAKTLNGFGIDKSSKDGRAHRCLDCKRAASKKYRTIHPEKVRAATARWAESHKEQVRQYRVDNREKAAVRSKKWAIENPKAAAAKTQRWRERNPEKVTEYSKRYNAENAEKVAKAKRAYRDANPHKAREDGARRRRNPKYRIEATIRSRLHRELGKKNGQRTFVALGYTSEELKAHLERQFSRGMSWDNYGEWQIDHIVPLSSFSYESWGCPELKAAWALSNLQPLWAEENRRKSDKRLTLL